MNDRRLATLGVALSLLAIILTAVAFAFFPSPTQQQLFWKIVLLGLAVVALPSGALFLIRSLRVGAVVAFLMIDFKRPSAALARFLVTNVVRLRTQFNDIGHIVSGLREVQFVNKFPAYCAACTDMLNKATDRESILTVQTPVPERRMNRDEETAYGSYINATVARIIETNIQYKRLVILREGDMDPETKIKSFVRNLITRAADRERTGVHSFDLNNTYVGFALPRMLPDLIYSNIDIHITSESDFSIAFLSRTADRQINFGSSLHLCDRDRLVSAHLRDDVEAIWNEIIRLHHYVEIGAYYPAFVAGNGGAKSDAARDGIAAQVEQAIDSVVTRLKTPVQA